jgi:hypothetical protein
MGGGGGGGWRVAAGGRRGLGVVVIRRRREEEQDERGDEQRGGGDGDLGLPQRRHEEAQRPRQALPHDRPLHQTDARRRDEPRLLIGRRVAGTRRARPAFWGERAAPGRRREGGREGGRGNAWHGQGARAFKTSRPAGGARSSVSERPRARNAMARPGWRRGAESHND